MEDYRIEETAPSPNKASPQLNCKILYVSGFRGTTLQAFNNNAAPASDETHVRNQNTRPSYVASGENHGGKYNPPPNVASGGINNATKDEDDDIRNNGALYDDAVRGDLEMTKRLVLEDNKACICPLNDQLQNVFHIISKREEEEDERVVEKLENFMSNMSVDDLGKKDRDGRTALHVAALYGNTYMAQVFISKNCHLLFESDSHHDLPVHLAARNTRHSEAVYTFFLDVTRQKSEEVQVPPAANPFELSSAMQLFCYLIGSKFYDLALDLVEMYDELGGLVAEIPGSKLDEKNPDVASHPLLKCKTSALQALVQFDCPIINTSGLSIWHSSISYLLQPKSMKNKMLMHQKAEKLLQHLCAKLKTLKKHKQVVGVAKGAMFEAARLDMDTVVASILDACPALVYCLDDNKRSVFHIAVENRSENVFNLLCLKDIGKRDLAEMVDVHGNGILHLAGKLAPPHKLNSASGAPLQMQRELQWFKEVEKVVPSYVPSTTNNDRKTPRSVFTEEHRSLKEEGEKLMKDTANSCTIAAALIVTVAFAAAITVPGGNNSDSGRPIFSKKTAFTVFAIANAGSLFTASTSMLAFLSILTSRYAEKDFLLALPRRSIIGLLTLFLSIIFMMTAFSATVYLVFGQNQTAIAVAVAVLACLPVSSFVLLQFPLIVALFSSTYGPGLFRKTKKPTPRRELKPSPPILKKKSYNKKSPIMEV